MASLTHAVLIADVVGSRSRRNIRELLSARLTAASRRHLRRRWIRLPYSVTAGDEFQTVTGPLRSLPELLLDLRVALRPLNLRIGIGLGGITGPLRPPVNRLDGEAFHNARRAIDSIKRGRRHRFETVTAFESRHERFDRTINLIYGLQDTLLLKITPKQWDAIKSFLRHPTLERSAKRLRLAESTVSRNLKRGYYWQLIETVNVAGPLIESAFR